MSSVAMVCLSFFAYIFLFYHLTLFLFLGRKGYQEILKKLSEKGGSPHPLVWVWVTIIPFLIIVVRLLISFEPNFSALVWILPYFLVFYGTVCIISFGAYYDKLGIWRRFLIAVLGLTCIAQIGVDWTGRERADEVLKKHDIEVDIAEREIRAAKLEYSRQYRQAVSENVSTSNSVADSFVAKALEFENDTIPLAQQRQIFDRLSALKDSAIRCYNSVNQLPPPYEGEYGFKDIHGTLVDGLEATTEVMKEYFELLEKRQSVG
jgi:hypothetical protein